MSEKPFIHLFETRRGYYLYDVNTDIILNIDPGIYDYLKGDKSAQGSALPDDKEAYVEKMRADGFLSSNRVKEIVHPANDVLEFEYERKLHMLIFQLTQNCNLRCSYCTYSGNYNNRTHGDKTMNIDLAKKGVDFLIRHSTDNKTIGFGFYGGEPLLRFDLVKELILYAEQMAEGKELLFALTSNGTLITREIIEFLERHRVNLMISIDGPREIHNKNRKFANNKGSFDMIYKNVQFLIKNFPSYFKNHVSFNMVFDTENDFSCVNDFIIKDNIFEDSTVSSTTINDKYSKVPVNLTADFLIKREYEKFKTFLYKLNRLDREYISTVMLAYYNYVRKNRLDRQSKVQEKLPEKAHHSGPCIPGAKRLFMSVDGIFYPCERVSELSDVMKIGSLENGIDVEKARTVLNVGKISEEQCKNCWAFKYCNLCGAAADDLHKLSYDVLKQRCVGVRESVEAEFMDYCALRECGHNFDDDAVKMTI